MAKKTYQAHDPAASTLTDSTPEAAMKSVRIVQANVAHPKPVLVSSGSILVSLGGYNHSASKSGEGFTLNSAGLPSDFAVESGSIGFIMGSVRQGFTVISTEEAEGRLHVRIAPFV